MFEGCQIFGGFPEEFSFSELETGNVDVHLYFKENIDKWTKKQNSGMS